MSAYREPPRQLECEPPLPWWRWNLERAIRWWTTPIDTEVVIVRLLGSAALSLVAGSLAGSYVLAGALFDVLWPK